MKKITNYNRELFIKDLMASTIVFLVALPLCLGIAMASGAPLFAGLIAGIIGGLVVGALSGSSLGVSGPAAGLAIIVLGAIESLGGYEIFLLAVVIAGILQVIMGFIRAGSIAYYFPSSVINGMLAGIGIIIFIKQIPQAFGYDAPDELKVFAEEEGLMQILKHIDHISKGPMLIAMCCLAVLIFWDRPFVKKYKFFNLVQGPLVAVVLGIVLNQWISGFADMSLSVDQLVRIPIISTLQDFTASFHFPNLAGLLNPQVYKVAIVLAVVGSLETLLSVEASDKQDPYKRVTPVNRELKAQGLGNIISGMLGGLPITQVVVRSSVNLQAGGQTKVSAILHGAILFLAVLLIPGILNKIPLATLAAILFVVGYKLAKPSMFVKIYKQGYEQFIPFILTVIGIVMTDLLIGIGIGMFVGVVMILRQNLNIPIVINDGEDKKNLIKIRLSEDVSFLKKAALLKALKLIPDGKHVIIDASKTYYIHHDIIDIIEDFQISAQRRNIKVDLIELYDHKERDPILYISSEEESAN